MGQLMLIGEYIIDTCSILSQKSDELYRRNMYKYGWKYIDECIMKGRVVTCSEIMDEIKDLKIKKWLIDVQCMVIDIDEEIQEYVKKIVTENPKMIQFNNNGSNTSSGDAFLIATAISRHLSIITQENKDSPNKIPKISQKYGIQTYSLLEFWEKENLSF